MTSTRIPLLLCFLFCPIGFAQLSNNEGTPFITASNCTGNQIFNPLLLKCVVCSNGTVPSSDRTYCECAKNDRIVELGPAAPVCEPCPHGQLAVGDGCFACEEANCSCDDKSVWTTLTDNGSSPVVKCEICPNGTYPSANRLSCEPCEDYQCYCQSGAIECPAIQDPTTIASSIVDGSGSQISSPYLEKYMAVVISGCSVGVELSCQALINMCVLQNYETDKSTSCSVLDHLITSRKWSIPTDPLFFSRENADSQLSREDVISQVYLLDATSYSGKLDIVLYSYHRNGSFAGTKSGETMIFCPENDVPGSAFIFGRRFNKFCSLPLSDVLRGKDTMFYEAYLKYVDNNGKMKMYILPVLNLALRSKQKLINVDDDRRSWVLTRRFMLVDSYSMTSPNGTSTHFRYADSIRLHVEMQPSRDGLIYPPFLEINYLSANEASALSPLPCRFRTTYEIDPSRHDRDVEITMSVLAPSSIVWAGLCAYSWGRRSGKQLLSDASTVVQFLLFSAAVLADVFFLVTTTIVVWLTFAYKSQTYIFYNMLNPAQESTMLVYLTVATCLKLAGLIQRHVMLIRQETFFIDWERPKVAIDIQQNRPLTGDISKERKELPVVVWRTYLVANEWNELQNYRKTSIAVQVLSMLFVLQFLGFENYAAVESGFSTDRSSPAVESALVTRFAVVVFFYLLVGFLQWTVQVLLIERIIRDPFHNFIDLCSISNISVLSLTHSLYGYYIHGRSVHGRADAGMAEMNDFLQRERDNLRGSRGLESSSELQTYFVALPNSFRRRYDEIVASGASSLPHLRLGGIDIATAKMAATVRVHEQMNEFIQGLVEHSNAEVDYGIRDRSFVEALLDVDTTDTSQTGNFLRDPSEMAFSRCFLYGNEWVNLSFECCLFCLTFIWWNSLPLSAVIVFSISFAIQTITSIACTHQLVKSSLVDQRFLI